MIKKSKKSVIIIAAVTALLICCELIYSNFALTVKKYTVESGFENSVKIAQVTDFHAGSSYISAENIISSVKKMKPDIIAVTGDMVDENSDEDDYAVLYDMLGELCKIAPVYFSPGNHDNAVKLFDERELYEKIAKTGVTVLNDSYVDVCVNGNNLRVGGMLDEIHHFYYTQSDFDNSPRSEFLAEFNDTQSYRIMLCHRPDSVNNYKRFNVSLGQTVLCGHTHGGIVRVPFGKAVFLPDMGWFDEYSYGFCAQGESAVIISSGLTSFWHMPRVFNPCEICLVTLK